MAYQSLHKRLKGPIRTALKKELKVANVHALPALEKVVVNVGINKSKTDSKEMQKYITETLGIITGQQPVQTKARMSISNFKVREGMVVGNMVTLRGRHMEDFLDRLLSYALPRIRDFRGLSRQLDGHGNYSIGIRDHSIFPEVPAVDAKQIFGLQVTIKTTTNDDAAALALFKQIGIPFRPEKTAADLKEEAEKQAKAEAKAAAEAAAEEPSDNSSADPDSNQAAAEESTTADKDSDAKKDDASVEPNADSDNTETPADDADQSEEA